MKAYAYRALFEPGDRRSTIVATFPDVPAVVTEGRESADARAMAEEALGLALLTIPNIRPNYRRSPWLCGRLESDWRWE